MAVSRRDAPQEEQQHLPFSIDFAVGSRDMPVSCELAYYFKMQCLYVQDKPSRIVAEHCLLTVETKRVVVGFQGVDSRTSLILAFTANSVEDANTYDHTLPIQDTT